MLLLRRWDETLAGKTQGKTTVMHGTPPTMLQNLLLTFLTLSLLRKKTQNKTHQSHLTRVCLCV